MSSRLVSTHYVLPPHADQKLKVPYISAAHKISGRWTTSVAHPRQNDPTIHHPATGSNALLCVSRDAKLTLMYQVDTSWQSTSVAFEDIDSASQLVTHAAFGREEDHLLLVTHDLSRRLLLYKIFIAWHPSQQQRSGVQNPVAVVAPVLDVQRRSVVDNVATQHTDAAALSYLCVVPRIPSGGVEPDSPTFPTVLAVFTHVSSRAGPTQTHEEAFSIIARWHIESMVPTLHPAFSKLKPNGTTATPQSAMTILRRQEDIMTAKIVLSVEIQHYALTLAFVASDGTIEFRDRLTMASVEPSVDTTTALSLPQAGFEHLHSDHSAHVAISADGSALVRESPDGSLTHKTMSLRYGWQTIENGITHGLMEAALVCLSRQYAILICSNSSTDETLALLPSDLASNMRTLFVKETLSIFGRNLDISLGDLSSQQLRAIREPLMPNIMGAQHTLYLPHTGAEYLSQGRFAWALLNMRLVCNTLAQMLSKPDIFMRPDFLASTTSLVQWGIDMLIYVADCLTSVKRNVKQSSGISAKATFEQYVNDKQSPAIHLLLSTYTRIYLRFLVSCIPKYLVGVEKMTPLANTVTEQQQLKTFSATSKSLPFNFTALEQLIATFDTSIRTFYTASSTPQERRIENEITCMTSTSIPDEFSSPLQQFFDTGLPHFMGQTDLTKLYFWNTSWLGIDDVEQARKYDVITKRLLKKDAALRVCRRCGAMMEDISPEKLREDGQQWVVHPQRFCICQNYWIMKDGEDKG